VDFFIIVIIVVVVAVAVVVQKLRFALKRRATLVDYDEKTFLYTCKYTSPLVW